MDAVGLADVMMKGGRAGLNTVIDIIFEDYSSSVHLLKISEPLVPPKPKELESAMLISALRAVLGT
jgi:hypothetical protein